MNDVHKFKKSTTPLRELENRNRSSSSMRKVDTVALNGYQNQTEKGKQNKSGNYSQYKKSLKRVFNQDDQQNL